MDLLFDTGAASHWLRGHGVRRAPATLRKLRCIGGGPLYRLFNGRPYYTEQDLVDWVEARLSTPRGNTSEADPAVPPAEITTRRKRRLSSAIAPASRRACPAETEAR